MRSVPVSILSATLLLSVGVTLLQADRLGEKQAKGLLAAGASVPSVSAKTLDGETAIIPSGGKPLVIFVFDPRCVADCLADRAMVLQLAKHGAERYRFVGIATSDTGLSEYLSKNPMPFPVYRNPSVVTTLSYRMSGSPKTIVVSTEGKIERSWDGSFRNAAHQASVEAYFGVKAQAAARNLGA